MILFINACGTPQTKKKNQKFCGKRIEPETVTNNWRPPPVASSEPSQAKSVLSQAAHVQRLVAGSQQITPQMEQRDRRAERQTDRQRKRERERERTQHRHRHPQVREKWLSCGGNLVSTCHTAMTHFTRLTTALFTPLPSPFDTLLYPILPSCTRLATCFVIEKKLTKWRLWLF